MLSKLALHLGQTIFLPQPPVWLRLQSHTSVPSKASFNNLPKLIQVFLTRNS